MYIYKYICISVSSNCDIYMYIYIYIYIYISVSSNCVVLCSVLQRVAMCCRTIAVCCRVLQCVAVWEISLNCVGFLFLKVNSDFPDWYMSNWAGGTMGWPWLVGSIKSQVSFVKEPCKRDIILQKRPIILSVLLSVATPYLWIGMRDEFWVVSSGSVVLLSVLLCRNFSKVSSLLSFYTATQTFEKSSKTVLVLFLSHSVRCDFSKVWIEYVEFSRVTYSTMGLTFREKNTKKHQHSLIRILKSQLHSRICNTTPYWICNTTMELTFVPLSLMRFLKSLSRCVKWQEKTDFWEISTE